MAMLAGRRAGQGKVPGARRDCLVRLRRLPTASPRCRRPWPPSDLWGRAAAPLVLELEAHAIADQCAELWRAGVAAFVGPQRTCAHEARMAASFNLPMISHFCEEAETSDKVSDELICVTGSDVGYSDTAQTKEKSVWL